MYDNPVIRISKLLFVSLDDDENIQVAEMLKTGHAF